MNRALTQQHSGDAPAQSMVEAHGTAVHVAWLHLHAVEMQPLHQEPREGAEEEVVQEDGHGSAQQLETAKGVRMVPAFPRPAPSISCASEPLATAPLSRDPPKPPDMSLISGPCRGHQDMCSPGLALHLVVGPVDSQQEEELCHPQSSCHICMDATCVGFEAAQAQQDSRREQQHNHGHRHGHVREHSQQLQVPFQPLWGQERCCGHWHFCPLAPIHFLRTLDTARPHGGRHP